MLRNIRVAMSLLALIGVCSRAASETPSSTAVRINSQEQALQKVVVHINFADVDRQKHGLGNVENMLRASKKPMSIEVVAHGGGLPLLVKGKSRVELEIKSLAAQGVKFVACENTMAKDSVTPDQLLSGVGTVPSGALEIVARQSDGFSYFKP